MENDQYYFKEFMLNIYMYLFNIKEGNFQEIKSLNELTNKFLKGKMKYLGEEEVKNNYKTFSQKQHFSALKSLKNYLKELKENNEAIIIKRLEMFVDLWQAKILVDINVKYADENEYCTKDGKLKDSNRI